MEPSDAFFEAQESELQKYSTQRVKDLLRQLEAARRDIYASILETGVERERLMGLIAQIDTISSGLQRDLAANPTPVEHVGKMVQRHFSASIEKITERQGIYIAWNAITPEIITRFSQNELKKVTSITAVDQIQAIKSALFSQVGIQGQNPQQVAKRLAGKDGLFTNKYGIVENIMRTEVSTIYNEQGLLAIHNANETYGLTLNKKIIERIDDLRNHPISQVINGQVQLPDKPFRAEIAKVKAVGKRIHKPLRLSAKGGYASVFWPVKGDYFEGQRLPAHYRERGIVVASGEPPNLSLIHI